MNIQSLSVAIPGGCPNNCKFCVSKLHKEIKYPNHMEYEFDEYVDRLRYAKQLGVNTIILTGEGEPLYNIDAMKTFFKANKSLKENKFINIELQTSGVGLLKDLDYLKANGVKTISLSLSNMLDGSINHEINRNHEYVDIVETCRLIKDKGFNLRLSLNMNDSYEMYDSLIETIFFNAKNLYFADQITFRKLYRTEDDNPVNNWIKEHGENLRIDGIDFWEYLSSWIKENGTALERLPFGARKYSVKGISTVIDDDCMNKNNDEAIKYLILRPNCKLYTQWDDKGSLLF